MKRLLLFFTVALLSTYSIFSQVPQSERDALIAFYNATNGDNWTNNTNWNTATPVSTWFGITTVFSNGEEHVSAIWIQDNNLSGTLSGQLQNLEFLVDLVLDQNNIGGVLPSQLANINNLFRISLFGNNLIGNIPSEYQLLNNLQVLNLGSNQLSGNISSEIGNFSSLTFLSLHTNFLTGALPPELGNLSNLTILALGNNQFSGAIPSTFGQLSNLIDLDLRSSGVSSAIPSEIGNMTNLSSLYLQGNNLSGSIPLELANNTNLFRINVQDNNMTGLIPTELTSLPNLNELRIENNNFQFGDFETDFNFYQTNLAQFIYAPQKNPDENFITEQTLNIGDNITLNAAPVSGTNTFHQWYLDGNAINGATTTSLELQNVQLNEMGVYQCYAFNSTITGLTLRTAIHTLNRVNTLHPEYNDLVAFYNATDGDNWTNNTNWLTDAPINTWYGLGTLRGDGNTRVTAMYLNNNNLTGEIPDEIGNFSNLFNLELGGNNLTGAIPQSITNLNQLAGLALYHNNLSGIFPDISANNNLNYVYINNNNFQFGDLEPSFTNYQNKLGVGYVYSPQKAINTTITTKLISIGDNVDFTSELISGENTIYQWYFNGTPIDINSNPNITDTTQPNFQISNITANQLGIYDCIAFNTLVFNLSYVVGTYEVGIPPTESPDYNALVTIYNSTNGDTWTNNTNWLNTTKPISTWFGITETNGRVTGINLTNNNVIGSIPSELTDLTELEVFWIQGANLSGEIPSSIGDLTKLRQLILFQTNGLTGNIPTSLQNCTNLEWALLSYNQLEGNIPDLTGLNNLTDFYIDNNKFQFGDFENEFASYQTKIGSNFVYAPQKNIGQPYNEAVAVGGSTTLFAEGVSGAQNTLTWSRINADGSQGGTIGNNTSVDITITSSDDYKWFYFYEITSTLVPGLTLRSEFFRLGDIPSNHPDYDALIAIYNAFDGANWDTPWAITKPIHDWTTYGIGFDPITDRVISLELYDGSGSIVGIIPPEIGDLTELETLVIINNNIFGEIPAEIWTLTKLKMLILGGQQSKQLLLSNGIPPEIANLQDLEWLNLTQIPLTQPLQPELFNLPKLLRLRIVECGLTGTLPAELAGISDVLAYRNEFEGAIPQAFIDAIGNSNLQIQDNFFNFSDLEPLVMANNYTSLTYSPQRTKDIAQNLEFAPGSDIILNIDDTSLNKAVLSKGAGDEYQWYKDNVAINGANAISYTIVNAQESDSGVYYCEITNDLLPDLTINRANITILIDAALSTEELAINDINIYPNPTKNTLNIKLNNSNKAEASLYDMSGRLVLKEKLNPETSVINMRNLNSGIYLLKIVLDNTIITKRIIKQ
tara:strand:- start:4538 stop:8548 length:4011 start_codon:yes stop_codon:yes gene_type:complete